jgi:hypothetical protein
MNDNFNKRRKVKTKRIEIFRCFKKNENCFLKRLENSFLK